MTGRCLSGVRSCRCVIDSLRPCGHVAKKDKRPYVVVDVGLYKTTFTPTREIVL